MLVVTRPFNSKLEPLGRVLVPYRVVFILLMMDPLKKGAPFLPLQLPRSIG